MANLGAAKFKSRIT